MLGKIDELLILALIIMMLFGAKNVPEVARSMGKTAREIRKGLDIKNNQITPKTSQKKKQPSD